VSDCSARDERRICVRQSRVVLAPVAGVRGGGLGKPDRARRDRQFADDGDKTNSSPGSAE
jgi:hypothetical protein